MAIQKYATLTVLSVALVTISAQPAPAQDSSGQSLNQIIRSESNALGSLTKDLGAELGGFSNMAKKFGDPNLKCEVQQLKGNGQSMNCSDNMRNEMSTISKQVSHIPGLSQMLSAFQGMGGQQAQKQFGKPTVISKLLPQFGGGSVSALAGSNTSGSMNMINQLCGTSAGGNSAAVNSELNEAGSIMPAAVKNMEQENQEMNQLLNE